MLRAAVAMVIVASVPRVAAAAPYTIEDLEALARHGKWDDVVAHLRDIPSDKRGPAWADLNERAAVGLLAAAPGGDLGALDVAEGMSELTLADDGAFAKRKRALVARLAKPATAWKAAQLAGAHYDEDTAIELFAVVFDPSKHCADPVLGDMVVRALGDRASDEPAKQAHKMATACYPSMAQRLRARLWEPNVGFESDYFTNVCGLLKSHDNLSGLQKRECAR